MNPCVIFWIASLVSFSDCWQYPDPLNPCRFLTYLEGLHPDMMPFKVLQVHTCVAALQGFDPAFQLKLPDGSNCSGIWGLRSASYDACVGTPFWGLSPYSWGCFYFALSNEDPISVIRYNACQELQRLATNDSSTDPAVPTLRPPFKTNPFQDPSITFWEEVVCMYGQEQEVLHLPNDNAKIVVAAQTYEQVLREMKPFNRSSMIKNDVCTDGN